LVVVEDDKFDAVVEEMESNVYSCVLGISNARVVLTKVVKVME
jgi:hypothetical protein